MNMFKILKMLGNIKEFQFFILFKKLSKVETVILEVEELIHEKKKHKRIVE